MPKNFELADELMLSMGQNLMLRQADDVTRSSGDVTTAIGYLIKAAEILENIGDHETAEDITKFLETINEVI